MRTYVCCAWLHTCVHHALVMIRQIATASLRTAHYNALLLTYYGPGVHYLCISADSVTSSKGPPQLGQDFPLHESPAHL
jgi:hypothetical protein